VVDVGLVDFRVLEFDGVGEEAAEAAAPLDDSGNRHTKHQIIGLQILRLVSQLLQVFEVFGSFAPGQCLAELSSWSFMVKRFIEHLVYHAHKSQL